MSDNNVNNSIEGIKSSVENANFLDIAVNSYYDIVLTIRYNWYFKVLGYSKDQYLNDVADPVYDGLRDRGYLDKINSNVSDLASSKVIIDENNIGNTNDGGSVYNPTGVNNISAFAQYNPFKNGVISTSTVNTDNILNANNGTGTSTDIIGQALGKIGISNTRDSDGDGIPDLIDSHPYDANNLSRANMSELFSADYSMADKVRAMFSLAPIDVDGDGLPDSYEEKIGTSPLASDTDIDGISDLNEIIGETDPLLADTDGDGVMDGRDMEPLNKFISVRSEFTDTDGDGVSDIIERYIGGDINKKDTDDDGIADGLDVIINGDNALAVKYVKGYETKTLVFNKNNWLKDHMSIENGILGFATDIISMFMILVTIFFVWSFTKWLYSFLAAARHYEHTFNDSSHHGYRDEKDHDAHHGDDDNDEHETDHYMSENDNTNFESIFESDENKNIQHHSIEEHLYTDKWNVVSSYMNDEMEAMWRLGIIEADNLLYEVLDEKGYKGDTLGEMLKDANFRSLHQAWDAHKVRNRIAHDGSSYTLTDREARRVYHLYEEVMRELKAIV